MPNPPKKALPPPPSSKPALTKISFGKLAKAQGQKFLIYGTGGIGKSSLCCLAPNPVAYVDAEERLPSLKAELAELGIAEPVTVPANNWTTLRASLQAPGWDGIKSIALDSLPVIEEWCIQHVLATVKTFEKPPMKAHSLEDYGFGKDIRLVYENFVHLLVDLERHVKAGRHIFMTCHDCKPEESNPMGSNYVRFEPRLRTSKKGDNSIRLKVKEWCDFVGFICYDLSTGKDNRGNETKKAVGAGSRTMYLQETPMYMAKNHGHPDSIDLDLGVSPWEQLIKE